MDAKYRALLKQTADVIHTKIVTRANRGKAHAVIVDFIKANPQMTYPEIAKVFGLHPVTVNRTRARRRRETWQWQTPGNDERTGRFRKVETDRNPSGCDFWGETMESASNNHALSLLKALGSMGGPDGEVLDWTRTMSESA